jgi:hypothetical protein
MMRRRKLHTGFGTCHGHLFSVSKIYPDTGTPHIDTYTHFAFPHTACHVVSLHFFGSPPSNSSYAVVLHRVTHNVLELFIEVVKFYGLNRPFWADLLSKANIALCAAVLINAALSLLK